MTRNTSDAANRSRSLAAATVLILAGAGAGHLLSKARSAADGSTGTRDLEIEDLRRTVQELQETVRALRTAPERTVEVPGGSEGGEFAVGASSRPPAPSAPIAADALRSPGPSDPTSGTPPDPEGVPGVVDPRLDRLLRLPARGEDELRARLAREILDDPNAEGRWAALQVLVELQPAEALSRMRSWIGAGSHEEPDGVALEDTLSTLAAAPGLSGSTELLRLYRMGDEAVQRAAARALARSGDDSLELEFVSTMQSRMRSDDPRIRLDATDQLVRIGSARADATFEAGLEDSSSDVRLRALEGLRSLRGDAVLPLLERLVADPSLAVRTRAERMRAAIQSRQRALDEQRSKDGPP